MAEKEEVKENHDLEKFLSFINYMIDNEIDYGEKIINIEYKDINKSYYHIEFEPYSFLDIFESSSNDFTDFGEFFYLVDSITNVYNKWEIIWQRKKKLRNL
jgi:ribosomal protein S1